MFNSLLMGGIEFFRNSELDPEKRCYPGGLFDPLNLADPANPERAFSLKTAEIKHARLAMVAALGAPRARGHGRWAGRRLRGGGALGPWPLCAEPAAFAGALRSGDPSSPDPAPHRLVF